MLLAFELAEREAATTGQHKPLSFVIVGGGPTGVELAGTLAEISNRSLSDDFRNINPEANSHHPARSWTIGTRFLSGGFA